MERFKVIALAFLLIYSGNAFGGENAAFGGQHKDRVGQFRQRSIEQKHLGEQLARRAGMPVRFRRGGSLFEVMGVSDRGRPLINKTMNKYSALTINVDDVVESGTWGLDGGGVLVGVWDANLVLASHQEFGGRVVWQDSGSSNYHATHVAGTIGAAGVDPHAKGMASAILIDSYQWDNDDSEMLAAAMSYAGQIGSIQLSNHSYGYANGWDNGSPKRWYGVWGDLEDDLFGRYSIEARQWDEICNSRRYYLPFKSVGNDRNDSAPADGESFEYFNNGTWKTKTYNSSIHPPDDGWDNGGFDTLDSRATAKNIMTVGAVQNGYSPSVRDLGSIYMTSFSGWGPTDDGRIKPDVVARGQYVYSCDDASDSSYATRSGTSMASPSACGAAGLLAEYYYRCFGGYMLASTIKGLMIHTADDMGNAGPDYKFGWGLLNIERAVEVIAEANDFPMKDVLVEDIVNDVDVNSVYDFDWDGAGSIRVTICWTDPEGGVQYGVDDSTIVLVNDLDLRLIDPCGVVFYPYVLNPASADSAAVSGDNFRDNVEQVYIDAPIEGRYRAVVDYKGALTNGWQEFSLIISGQRLVPVEVNDVSAFTGDSCGEVILSWVDVNEADGYRVFYQEGLAGPDYVPVVDGMPVSGADVGDVNYVVISGLTAGADYHFSVKAYNAAGESGYSADVNAIVNFQCPVYVSGSVLTVSGNGIEGVGINFGGSGIAITDVNGDYTAQIPWGWGGSVDCSKTMWSFEPADVNISGPLTADINDVDFVGKRLADFEGDGEVDMVDYSILAGFWQQDGCEGLGWCTDSDLDLSGKVDIFDLQLFMEDWLY